MQRLDELSRQVVHRCLVRLSVLSLLLLTPWLLGLRSFAQITGSLSEDFTLIAMITMIIALWRRETPGRGSLNNWDESLAFNAFAVLAHMLHRFCVAST